VLANKVGFGNVCKVFEMCGRVVCGVFLIATPVECQTSKIAVALGLTSQSSSKTAETPTITVGPNVEVSRGDDAESHDEVLIAAHPSDPNELLACSMVDPSRLGERKMHTAAYFSDDGGKTWALGPRIPESGDPVCEFSPEGAAYFGAIGDSPDRDPAIDWHLKLYRSNDQGKTWEQRSDFVAGDRPWMAFDTTGGANRGWMYVAFQSRAGVLDSQQKQLAVSLDLTRSTDNGSTWSLPRVYGVIDGRRLAHSLPTGMATLSDGTVVISNWQNLKKNAIETDDRLASSWPGDPGNPTCEIAVVLIPPDGWKRPKTVKAADKYCSEGPTTRTVDTLAVDNRSEVFKDRIYIAWVDARSGHARILFTYSSDRGDNWSAPRVLDDVPLNLAYVPDSFMPTLAVNKDGVIGLTWNDRRDNPDNIGYFTRFAASLDGGESWLPSMRVSEQPARFRQGMEGETLSAFASVAEGPAGRQTIRIARSGEFHAGDTAGLRADAAGVFHALWIDNRNGRDEVYTAPIHVAGTVAKHGSVDLAGLAGISDRVRFEIADVDYDTKSQVITLRAVLRNKSKDVVKGRLIVRVLSLDSQAAALSIVNADNPLAGAGAVFDFSGLANKGSLEPERSTETKTIRFQLRNVAFPPVDEKNIYKVLSLEFVNLQVEILGDPPADESKK
jgi:hypothetical protein